MSDEATDAKFIFVLIFKKQTCIDNVSVKIKVIHV